MELNGDINVTGIYSSVQNFDVEVNKTKALENIISLNSFFLNTLRHSDIHMYNELFENIGLSSIIEKCHSWRSYTDNSGNTYGGEPISHSLFLGILPSLWKEIKEAKYIVSIYDLLEAFFNLDPELNNTGYIYGNGDFQINRYLTVYRDINNIEPDNVEFIKNNKIELGDIERRVSEYNRQYNRLGKHLTLSKIDEEFKLGLCSISNRKSPPIRKLYTNDSDPYNTNDIIDSLIYKEKGFYITDILNDEGMVKFKTNDPENEIIGYVEMKELCKDLLSKYNNEIISKIVELNNQYLDLNEYVVKNVNDLLTILRMIKEGKNENTKES